MGAFIVFLTGMAAIGGFLFGYDTGVISGAMILIRQDFNLSAEQQEVVVSITVTGAIFGACFGGLLTERRGRKPAILLSSLIFLLGSVLLSLSSSYNLLVFGRLIVGLGIGMASLAVPMYIAEAAPAHLRGMLVTLNTLFITGGQFTAGMVDGLFSSVPGGWRWMLGLGALPAAVQLCGFGCLPESPRWLAARGRRAAAARALARLRRGDRGADPAGELAAIRAAIEEEEAARAAVKGGGGGGGLFGPWGGGGGGAWAALWGDRAVRRALVLGCGLQALQQAVGINTVMYYAASIYSMAGFGDASSIWLSGFTALAQVAGVALGVALIERVGRRPLVLASLALVVAALVALGAGFYAARAASPPVVAAWAAARGMGGGEGGGEGEGEGGRCAYYANAFLGRRRVDSCYACTLVGGGCGFCGGESEGEGGGLCLESEAACAAATGGAGVWEPRACPDPYAWLAAAAMVGYLLAFGVGMSSVPWTVNAEIYPLHARSACTALATSVNWAGNVLVSASFLTLASPAWLQPHGAFWLYAAVGCAGWVWLWARMPETRGLGLEEIVARFRGEEEGGRGGDGGGGCGEGGGDSGGEGSAGGVARRWSGGGGGPRWWGGGGGGSKVAFVPLAGEEEGGGEEEDRRCLGSSSGKGGGGPCSSSSFSSQSPRHHQSQHQN